ATAPSPAVTRLMPCAPEMPTGLAGRTRQVFENVPVRRSSSDRGVSSNILDSLVDDVKLISGRGGSIPRRGRGHPRLRSARLGPQACRRSKGLTCLDFDKFKGTPRPITERE